MISWPIHTPEERADNEQEKPERSTHEKPFLTAAPPAQKPFHWQFTESF
jgi:hypothetical protein